MIDEECCLACLTVCFPFSHDRAKKKSSLKSMMSSRSGGSSGSGGTICGVLLDSVIHAGHIAAIHADRTDCGQCRDFVVKMKADLKDITANRTSVSEGGEEFYNDRVSY